MKKFYLILLALGIGTLSINKPEQNNQCLSNKGVWVEKESSFLAFYLNKPSIYLNYSDLYIKSNLTNLLYKPQFSKCKKVRVWFEDGLSLNKTNKETKKLVFNKKIDDKYWLDISKPETKVYLINRFDKFCKKYNYTIHLDDHWAIPKEYGKYSTDLLTITRAINKSCGALSLSILPLNYSIKKYNLDWFNNLKYLQVEEIILQNYSQKNFDIETSRFKEQSKYYPAIEFKMGIYLGEINHLNLSYKKLEASTNMKVVNFPLRSAIIRTAMKIF